MKFKAFEWDIKNTGHIAQHSVIPEEAEETCFHNPLILRSRHGRYLVLGQTESGRYLTVVIQPKPGGIVRVITAREMNNTERQRYLRR
ncbi:MAG: BrnT family toxin [Candidatus Omnitrophota bacterium]|nr:BrnT family toxin [Candidatus Omnitrophota bacterium]